MRIRAASLFVACTLAITGIFASVAAAPDSSVAAAPPVTYAGGNNRTGWFSDQAGLTPDQVARADFQQRFDARVHGQVYAQPLVANGTLLVATEDNYVYGLDPNTGATKWARQLRKPFAAADVGCSDLVPNIGVTGTPVVDQATGTLYLLAKGYVNGVSGTAGYWMYSINIATGADRFTPQPVAGKAQDGKATFAAKDQIQRPGLLLAGGRVFAAFSGHCGSGNYRGYVVALTPGGAVAPKLWTSIRADDGLNGAGIWMSGAAILSDADSRLYVATGNAHGGKVAAAQTNVPRACGNCVVRLDLAGGALSANQFFSPMNANNLDANDSDLGSGGLIELPPAMVGNKRVIAAAGKEGYVYLLDAENLGGFQQGAGGSDKVLARVGRFGGVWSKPTAWQGDGGWLYIPTASPSVADSSPLIDAGSSGYLQAYRVGLDGAGRPTLTRMTNDAANTDAALGFGSSPTVVTSNGAANGSAVVWVVQTADGSGANAKLRAYRAVPVGGKMQLLKSFNVGTAAKFSSPGVAGNRVYVGTRDGHVRAFGTPPVLAGSGVAFADTIVGQHRAGAARLQAERALTVRSVSVSGNGFTRGACTCAGAMAAGAATSIPVTFSPTAAATFSGKITVVTNIGTFEFALGGRGVSAGARPPIATPSAVNFGALDPGDPSSIGVTITNPGSTAASFLGVDAPAAPFSLSGVPGFASVLAAGASRTITATMSAGASGNYSGSFRVRLTTGSVTVPLRGSVRTPARLVVSATVADAGVVQVGARGVTSLLVANAGQLPLTITLSKAPAGQFTALDPLPEGTRIAPGTTKELRVAFRPTRGGSSSATWTLNGDGASAKTTVTFTGIGVGQVSGGLSLLRAVHTARLGDTRRSGGRLQAGDTRGFSVAGAVPAGARAASVALVVTAVNPSARGYLTVYDCDLPRPATSNVNYAGGRNTSNMAIVDVAGDGTICVFSSVASDVVVDMTGYASKEEGLRYNPINPVRFYDSRAFVGPVRGGSERAVTITGGGLPSRLDSVLVNVAAVNPTADGYFTVYPCGTPRAAVANLNFQSAHTTAGLTQVRLGNNHQICVYSNVTTHLVVDVEGYFRSDIGAYYAGINPVRALDTRSTHSPIPTGAVRMVTTAALGGPHRVVPANAVGVLLNVAVVDSSGNGFLTVYPCGTAKPIASTLNFTAHETRANLVASKLGGGGICIYSSVDVHVVVDTVGWMR